MFIHQRKLANCYNANTTVHWLNFNEKVRILSGGLPLDWDSSSLVAFIRYPQFDGSVTIARRKHPNVLAETKRHDWILMPREHKERWVENSFASANWWRQLPNEQIVAFCWYEQFALLSGKARNECWRWQWQGNPVSSFQFLVGAKVVNSLTFLRWTQQTTAIKTVSDITSPLIGR